MASCHVNFHDIHVHENLYCTKRFDQRKNDLKFIHNSWKAPKSSLKCASNLNFQYDSVFHWIISLNHFIELCSILNWQVHHSSIGQNFRFSWSMHNMFISIQSIYICLTERWAQCKRVLEFSFIYEKSQLINICNLFIYVHSTRMAVTLVRSPKIQQRHNRLQRKFTSFNKRGPPCRHLHRNGNGCQLLYGHCPNSSQRTQPISSQLSRHRHLVFRWKHG